MRIKYIWAQDKNGLIGDKGHLPWKNSGDMSFFKNQTTGGIVVMGYKTWESLGCKPLQNRINVVITHKNEIPGYEYEDVYIAKSLEEIDNLSEETGRDIWVIGGASIFELFEYYCTEAVVSVIEGVYDGDTHYIGLKDKMIPENVVSTMKGEGFYATHYVFDK